MLQLILGRAGSGKTTYIDNLIKDKAVEGKKIFYLVPEQYSFQTERNIYNILGSKLAAQVKVVSFTSLAYHLFRHLGFPKGKELTKAEKQLSMALALEELKDSLTLYGSYAVNANFIGSMIETIEDFKSAGLNSMVLKTAVNQENEPLLNNKIEDLTSIYETYQGILEKNGADPKDKLIIAGEKAAQYNWFKDSYIYIDGFMAFTPVEHDVIATMSEQCKELYISLTTPNLMEDDGGLGCFAGPRATAKRLIQQSKEKGVPVKTPVILEGDYRYNSADLKNFQQSYMDSGHTKEVYGGDIEVNSYQEPYSEIIALSANIKSLIYDKGYRYSDIAIITRDLTRYEGIISRVFGRYEIPFFMDATEDLSRSPIVMTLYNILDCIKYGMDSHHMLKLAKSPLMSVDKYQCSLLENYCYTWGVKGSQFASDFINSPSGMGNRPSKDDESQLKSINDLRAYLYNMVSTIKEAMKEETALAFATGVYNAMNSLKIKERLEDISQWLEEDKKITFLKEENLVWEEILKTLDTMVDMLGEHRFSFIRLYELFGLCLTAGEYGKLPQTQDQVIVGTADRIRVGEIKAAFVIGCVEGEFPAVITGGGVLSPQERERITQLGIKLTADIEEKASYENYYSYYAISRSSEKLYLSYSLNDHLGKSLEPSVIINQMESIFGVSAKVLWVDSDSKMIWNEATAVDVISRMLGAGKEKSQIAKALGEQIYTSRFSHINSRGKTDYMHSIGDNQVLEGIYGSNLYLSPSKIENFYNCRFKYFLSNTLKINNPRKVELSPIEAGSLIHYVLETMVKSYGNSLHTLKEEELEAQVEELIAEFLSKHISDLSTISARLRYLFNQLAGDIVIIVKQLAKELEQSLFTPEAFEQEISYDSHYKPISLKLETGQNLVVSGVVDRIDSYETDGIKYIRVVDYKSGIKSFRLSDVYYGLNMQMLMYLFAICGQDFIQNSTKPAGVLYMPVKNTLVSVDNSMTDEQINQKKQETMRMNGLVLAKQDVIYGMERGGEGIFIPAKIKKGEIDSKSSVASLAEMGRLHRMVEGNLLKMGEYIYSGDVAAMPTQGTDNQPCKYCDYSLMCGHSPQDQVRELVKKSNREILELAQAEQESQLNKE